MDVVTFFSVDTELMIGPFMITVAPCDEVKFSLQTWLEPFLWDMALLFVLHIQQANNNFDLSNAMGKETDRLYNSKTT